MKRTVICSSLVLGCALASAQPGEFNNISVFGASNTLDISADGTAIAYVVEPGGADAAVEVVFPQTGERIRLPGAVDKNIWPAYFITVRWSPDSSRLLYQVSQNGLVHQSVWSRSSRQSVTFWSRSVCSRCLSAVPQWSPDSASIYFLADNVRGRASDPQLYSLSGVQARERRQLLFDDPEHGGVTVRESPAAQNMPQSAAVSASEAARIDMVGAQVNTGKVVTLLSGARFSSLFLAPDGRTLLALARSKNDLRVKQRYYDYYLLALTSNVFAVELEQHDAPGVRDWRGHSLAPVIERVKQFVPQAAWSPDSRQVAFAELGELAQDVFILNAKTRRLRNLTASLRLPIQSWDLTHRNGFNRGKFGHEIRPPVWSRDATRLFAFRREPGWIGEQLWSISVANGKAVNLTPDADVSLTHILHREGVVVGPDPRKVIVSAQAAGRGYFIEVDAETGKRRQLVSFSGKGAQSPAAMTLARGVPRMAFVGETKATPPEIFAVDLSTGQPKQLTMLNPIDVARDLPQTRSLSWKGVNGATDRGILLLPPASERPTPAQPPPVIAWVYPSNESRIDRFDDGYLGRPDLLVSPLTQLLHSGYAILLPDLPVTGGGSTCQDVAANVVASLDALATSGFADVSRAGVAGHSFGGWGVNCIVTRTARFAAAVSVAGTADLISGGFTWSSDANLWTAGGGQTDIRKSLWQAPELYMAESPLLSLPNVRTPLLLIHGKSDGTAPFEESVKMYAGLLQLGKTATLVGYDDRGHADVLSHPDFASRVVAWMDRYLRPETPHKGRSDHAAL